MNRREQETVQQIGIAFAENISGELGEDLPDGYWDHAGDVFLDAHADQFDELLADAWFAGFAAQVAPRDNPYVPSSGAPARPGEPSKATVRESHGCDSKGRENGTQSLSPDCRDGKCRACAGDAWDETTDQPADCGCDCHKEATK